METASLNFLTGLSLYVTIPLMPTILFVAVFYFDIFINLDRKNRLIGMVKTFLCSYMVLNFVEMMFFKLIEVTIKSQLTYTGLIILKYVVYFLCSMLFCFLMVLNLKWYNNCPNVKPIKPFLVVFVYTHYMLMIYVAMIVSESNLGFAVNTLILGEIWYLTFKKRFDDLSDIIPDRVISLPNICLFIEYFVVSMLWYIPYTLGVSEVSKMFFFWIGALGVVVYVFCLLNHNLIFISLIQQKNEIDNLSNDPLTKLLNRTSFIKSGQKLIDNSFNNKTALIYFNIADFKFINTNYGDEVGDQILKDFAFNLRETFGKKALISRLADDHFAVLDTDYNYIDDKINAFEVLLNKDKNNSEIRAGAGVYITDNSNTNILKALEGALRAGHYAKSDNIISIYYYDDRIIELENKKKYILDNIDKAIEDNKLKVYYQPLVDVYTKQLVGAEALIRWDDDMYGFMTPNVFIPILEEANQIYKIDGFVLEEICKNHIKLIDAFGITKPVSFNVSRRDFYSCNIVSTIEKIIEKYNLPKNLIKVEVTESALVSNEAVMIEQLNELNRRGYKVWMDDFGAGYSSLNTLGDFAFDGIKLDMLFLRNITIDRIKIMKSIVDLANNLGISILAEGVENEAHVQILKDIGCNIAQGYYYGKPMEYEDWVKLVKNDIQQ